MTDVHSPSRGRAPVGGRSATVGSQLGIPAGHTYMRDLPRDMQGVISTPVNTLGLGRKDGGERIAAGKTGSIINITWRCD